MTAYGAQSGAVQSYVGGPLSQCEVLAGLRRIGGRVRFGRCKDLFEENRHSLVRNHGPDVTNTNDESYLALFPPPESRICD